MSRGKKLWSQTGVYPPLLRVKDRPTFDVACELRAAGWEVGNIAQKLSLPEPQVRSLLATPEGVLAIERVRKAWIAELQPAPESAQLTIKSGLAFAAQNLLRLAKHPDPRISLKASTELLDRGGCPATKVVHQTGTQGDANLAKLSDEEFQQLQALVAKTEETPK